MIGPTPDPHSSRPPVPSSNLAPGARGPLLLDIRAKGWCPAPSVACEPQPRQCPRLDWTARQLTSLSPAALQSRCRSLLLNHRPCRSAPFACPAMRRLPFVSACMADYGMSKLPSPPIRRYRCAVARGDLFRTVAPQGACSTPGDAGIAGCPILCCISTRHCASPCRANRSDCEEGPQLLSACEIACSSPHSPCVSDPRTSLPAPDRWKTAGARRPCRPQCG